MYNIRLGVDDDVDTIIAMGIKFYSTMEMARLIPFDEDSGAAQVFHMLDNGFILLAETEDKEVVGMMGCSFFDWPFNRMYRGCMEHMFWIEEGHRQGGLAARFIKEAEEIARHEGVSFCAVAALETSPEGIDVFYKRMGYQRSERAFIKGV